MRFDVKEASERLFSACLAATRSGRVQAFIQYAAHVDSVSIDIYPGGTDYTSIPHPIPFLSERIYLLPFNWDNAERHAACVIAKMDALTIQLYAMAAEERAA